MDVKKAVIPAAGLGTRFLPVTKSIPQRAAAHLRQANASIRG